MVIKYSKLSSGDHISFDYFKWIKSRLPVPFLRQQMFLVCLVIGSLLLLILTTFFTSDVEYDLIQDLSTDFNYGVVVDCGSSGSRAHIYKWRQNPSTAQIEFSRDRSHDSPNQHIKPGLSSFKDDPDKASDYMEPIMSFISESIPQQRHIDTPVYFLATAGLRLLEEETQKKIMQDITRDLRVKFNFPKIKSLVISGELEGVYSWLSLNKNQKLSNASHDSKSYGIIEMGGASTQVTFELTPDIENAILKNLKNIDAITTFKSDQITMNFGTEKSVKLFAKTFLGLGVNSAREAAIDLLVRDYLNGTDETEHKKSHLDEFEIRLQDPCLTMGSNEIVLRPTTLLNDHHKTVGFVIEEHEKTFKVRLEGTGNFLSCMSLLNRLLKIVKKEKLNCPATKQTCPMDLLATDFIPYSYYPFIGLSEMFFTTNEMMNSAGLFNRSKILHETNRICSTQYNKLLDMYSVGNGLSFEDRTLYQCFKASWLLTILHSSGFSMPETYDNFKTVDKLDGEEIEWTMGAMIMEVAFKKTDFKIN